MRPKSSLGFNRLAVERALARAAALWRRLSQKDYPNGAIVFCSEEVAEVVHPPRPLTRRVYSCGRHFDTSVLKQMIDLESGPVYGAIAIDGCEASLGTVRGLGASPSIVKELHLTSTTASRTRRGGQSALRYSRLRDEAELAFLRKVAEHAHSSFADVQGLVLAGKADMKHKLLAELPDKLRRAVFCVVDLAGNADMQGLRQAALCASPAAVSKEQDKVEAVVNHFLELTAKSNSDASLCCYGVAQTAAALRLGAVKDLLVTAGLEAPDGAEGQYWKALASQHGARVLEVAPHTEQGVLFCNSFCVGGCLRWPVDPSMLDDEEEMSQDETSRDPAPPSAGGSSADVDTSAAPPATAAPAAVAARLEDLDDSAAHARQHLEGESASARTHACCLEAGSPDYFGGRDLLEATVQWLREDLQTALQDPSATEALVACVEVILGDEVSPPEEAAASAAEVLAAEGVPEAVGRELEHRWLQCTSLSTASEQ